MFRHDVARKRKGPRPPNGGLFFSGAVAMAACVGSVVRSFLPEWQATVAERR
ncbi:hypothetical protein ACFVFQ_25650 [Streptomyces sp. NPDC057743]|uniref:hypothetical protein n=1 Tax=Streptomyces sp. NPDC057743 TaxID=3346236 RepID=UPI0036A2B87B